MKKWGTVLVGMMMFVSVAQAADTIRWPTLKDLKSETAENIYDRPYSLWSSQVDRSKLYRNTGVLFGAGIGAMGILYVMPTSFTHWDSDDNRSPTKKWWDNVSREPVWDKDDFFLNYITHPYFGAVYYMGARSAGAGAGYSFLYSAALSTFFWEYGLEAFAERPSIQDLIVTPVFGSILGEGFYRAKRHIRDNGGELCGSAVLGSTAIFLMDPITEVTDWIFEPKSTDGRQVSFSSQPMVSPRHGVGYAVRMNMTF